MSPEAEFLEWAERSAVALDCLKALGAIIGDCSIVCLGEAVHCADEVLQFRNRLFQYLVEEKGFTAIAIESGVAESRAVYDYVRGAAGDSEQIAACGFSWGFGCLPQNVALVEWIRDYNARAECSRKINFYGFDNSGSPGVMGPCRSIDTALSEALEYLRVVDRQSAQSFEGRLKSLMSQLRFDPRRWGDGWGYDGLALAERDALTAGIEDLIALMEHKEAQYTAAGGAEAYAWGHRCAIGARQLDRWLRQIKPSPHEPKLTDVRAHDVRLLSAAEETRERTQADNLEWIVSREGASGKVLVFGHRIHLSSAPVERDLGAREIISREVAGTYLRRRFGASLLTIGNVIGGGAVACVDFSQQLLAADESIDAMMGAVGRREFCIDLRAAPEVLSSWLDCKHVLAHTHHPHATLIRQAFDVLWFLEKVHPACKTHPLK